MRTDLYQCHADKCGSTVEIRKGEDPGHCPDCGGKLDFIDQEFMEMYGNNEMTNPYANI